MKSSTRFALGSLVLICILLACTRRASPSQVTSGNDSFTIAVGDQRRSYILHLPTTYDSSQAVPLVLSFHGGGGNAEIEMRSTEFGPLADQEGFIVVYPDGSGRLEDKLLTWNGGNCCGYAVANGIDDVGFTRALIAELEASYKIDPRRIYATGLSNGAILSYRLACEASDLFAAIAPLSGTQNFAQCAPEQPVSVIHFHGTADMHVPYDGGIGDQSLAGVDFASVESSIQFWVNQDDCAPLPQTEEHDDIRHETYTDCFAGTSVELYSIIEGGHAWPGASCPGWMGGDPPTQSISATQLIWDFFQSHPKQ